MDSASVLQANRKLISMPLNLSGTRKRIMHKTLLSSLLAITLVGSIPVANAQGQSLNIAFADPLSSLDPQLNNYAGDRSVDLHFWDLLVENNYNKLQPGLALSWKNLDSKTWEFKLRPNVKWHDGTPFTAEDVIFSYQRARSVPGSLATFAGYLRTVESVTAKDPLTLIIKTNIPNPDLPLNLASVHIVSKHVGEKASTDSYNSGTAMVGTGPYKWVSYTPGEQVVMQHNDAYWGTKPLWDKVNYRYISNAPARTAALLSGDVDVIDKVSVADLNRAGSSDRGQPMDAKRDLRLQPGNQEYSERRQSSQAIAGTGGLPAGLQADY